MHLMIFYEIEKPNRKKVMMLLRFGGKIIQKKLG